MPLNCQVAYFSPFWKVYRVVAVAASEGNKHFDANAKSTTASTYCTPHIIFWLSLDGIEEPNVDCVILEFDSLKNMHKNTAWVEFDYDGGRYIGTLFLQQHHSSAIICNISSL